MISLERLFGKESAQRMTRIGLHKIAAARLQAEGHDVPDELDLRSAIQALGTNIYIKNAEYKNIIDGITCLRDMMQG
jgi:hypothetical protein